MVLHCSAFEQRDGWTTRRGVDDAAHMTSNLSRAENLIIAITATGWAESRPLLRSGAHPGDRLYVSRPLGAAAAGLELLTRWKSIEPPGDLPYAQREFAVSAIRRLIEPEPEVKLGIALADLAQITSCI